MKPRSLSGLMIVAVIILILPGASFVTTSDAGVIDLPQTGQTTCYDATGSVIPCAGTGQDGDIMAGVAWPSPRFTNPDGTTPVSGDVVLDQLTGLYWQRDGNASGLKNFDNGLTYCEGLSLTDNNAVSYNDFRMPNMLEMESIINFGFNETSFCSGTGCSSNAVWLNDEGFQDVQNDKYWASSAYAGVDYAGAWRINFDPAAANGFNDRPDSYTWSNTYYILCVRGGANDTSGGFPAEVRKTGQTTSLRTYDDGWFEWGITAWDAGRFTDNTDGTMTDNLTGLMWTKDGSLVSTLTGLDSMGIADWEKALDFVDYMNTGQSFCSSTLDPCSVNGDCAGNVTVGYCTNNPYNRCDDLRDCTAGTCFVKRCNNNLTQACSNDSECAGSGRCFSYKRCTADTTILCRGDADCPGADTCQTTNCYEDAECLFPAQGDTCFNIEGCLADGGETCLPAPPNYGYTDWHLPNFKELYESTVHFEGERMDDDLVAYGFMNVGGPPTTQPGRGCGIWTSTTDPVDSTRAYSTSFGWAGGMIRSYPKDTANTVFCGVGASNPYILWPVRTSLIEPNISVTPSSYDFGDAVQGTDADVTFTVNNIGEGDLSITNIAQNDTIDPPFSLVAGQDTCSGTVVAPGTSCTFDVRFSPIGRGGYNDTFDIQSNDPDTGTFIVSISGIGATAYTIELPQTGQTTSYSIADDGDIMAGVAWPTTGNMGSGRFNDNGDGTVTDLLTGLMWTKDANLINPNVGTDTYENLNNYVNNTFNAGAGYAGYNDWRIPNMLELESLTHYGQASPAAWLSGEGFTNVQAAEYWVSNLYADVNNGGWALNLSTHTTTFWHVRGTGGATDKYVWTVRSGANGDPGGFPAEVRKTGQTTQVLPRDDGALEWGVTAWDAGRFTDNTDGTMTDNLTGIMWTKDGSLVSTLTGIDNMGVTDWEKALDFVDYMNTGQSFCSSSIEACTVDGDCPGNVTIGYCTNNPYTRCDDDTGCGAGTCATIQNRCENNPSVTCTQHSDCPAGSNRFCRTGRRCSVSTNVICTKDAHCPGGETCVTTSCFDANGCIEPAEDECRNVEGCVADGGESCLPAPPNYGYDDWYLPNFKEVHSMTHWETERSDDDLSAYGFMNVGGVPTTQPGRGCGIWTSTTDGNDATQAFSTSFGWGANQIAKYPKDTAGQVFCGVQVSYPYIVWPVRTAAAPPLDPDISIAPTSYDFGNVVVGVTASTVFTVENLGPGDLDITSVSIPASDFSVQSEDCTTLSPLAQNDTCSISVDFTPSAEGIMTETLSVISNDPDTPTLTAGLTGTGIPALIDLELSKTVDNPSPVEGGTVLFTIAVTNNGPADATGVSVEDVVPDGYSNIRNISNGGTEAGGTITWSGLSIANSAVVNLTFNVDVTASGNYVNVAQVTAADLPDSDSTPNNDDGDQSEDDEDNASVSPVAVIIDLSLDKTVDNSTPFVGNAVTFTIAVTNSGPSDATGVEVKDLVPDGFSNIQNINFGGTESGGTITWSGLNINSGITRNLRYTANVHASGNYVNVAQVTAADQPDSDSTPNNDDGDQSEDDEDSQSVVPVFGIDLELGKSVSNPSPDVGNTVTFSIDVTNKGYLDATGITVADVVPDGYSNIRNISHGGTEAGGTITWSGLNVDMGSVDWFDTDWSYRQKITISSAQVSGDLSNFPVLINTVDPNFIVSPGGKVGKANGGDILFTNSNGTGKFDHEIESYNSATGELVAWVMMPQISSTTDTVIYMYYGNANAADQWNTNGTWDSNYVDVLHFTEEQAGTGNLALYRDSTANNNHGDDHVSASGQEGKIGRGQEFDGIDDYVSVSDNSTLDITDELTLEVWVKSTTTSHQVVVDKRDLVRNPPGWWRFSMDDTGLSFQVSNTNWFFVDWPVSIIDNTWHHVTGVMNGKIQIYVDGILRNEVNNVVGNMTTNDAPLLIGKWIGDMAYYQGFIDEVRVSKVARSADWISTSYNNQNDPSAFTSFGTEEVYTPASASAIQLTFDADVNAIGTYLNVAEVVAADQPDSDSAPNNDDGDQSEDDEDNTIIVLPGAYYSVLNQPRTNPGDPYPCNLWYAWCDPERGGSWPANAVYAAPWDDVDISPCGGCEQVLAEHFEVKVETAIMEIKAWGGYWHGDVPPAVDNITLIFHDDAGGTIGNMVAQPAFTVNRVQITTTKVPMPYNASQSGSSHIFEYTLTLTEPLTLTPGTYWVEFFNDTTGHANNNDFFWVWGYRDYIDGRGIDGLAWTTQLNEGGSGTSWNIDTEGNLAIEINGQAAGAGCTLRVKNLDTSAEYCTIYDAYVAAGDGHTIQVKAESYTETLDFNIDKTMILQGGYDNTYATVTGITTIIGDVAVSNGSVTMGDFIVQ